MGRRREGGGGVRSSGETGQRPWSEGALLLIFLKQHWEARAR